MAMNEGFMNVDFIKKQIHAAANEPAKQTVNFKS